MKRIMCLVIAIMLLFSCNAFAANNLDFLKERYTSAESTFECSFTLNKPLDFINALNESGIYGMELLDNMFDFSKLAESLFGSTSKGITKISASGDMKKISMSLEAEDVIPAQINRNLLVTVNSKSGMWLDLDFSDEKNPIYNVILRTPSMDKYEAVDVVDIIKSEENGDEQLKKLVSVYNLIVNKFTADGINTANINLIADCAKVSYGGAAVTISFDDAGFKKYILGIIDTINDITKTADILGSVAMPNGNSDNIADSYEFALNTDIIKTFLEKVNILGKDGMVIRYGLAGNIITSIETKTNIALNVGNIARACDISDDEAAEYDNMNIDFTCSFKANYRNVNRSVKIDRPELNSENSFSLNELIKQQDYENEYPADYDYTFFGVYTDNYLPLGTGNAYIGVRDLFESTDADFDVFYNNGVVSIAAADDTYGFKNARFTVGSNTVNVDGMELALLNPTIEKNDTVYVDSSFVVAVFNFDLTEIDCYPIDGGVYCAFTKRSW